MTWRRSFARGAVRTFPPPLRDERAEELTGTLLDAGAGSPVAFTRELASVVAAGWRGRARLALSQPVGGLVGRALVWAALFSVARILGNTVYVSLHWSPRFLDGPALADGLLLAGPIAILVAFAAGRSRAAGLLGVSWAITGGVYWSYGGVLLDGGLAVALAGFAVLVITGQRPSPAARGGFLLCAALLFGDHWVLAVPPLFGPGCLVLVAAVSALLPCAPAGALGVAVVWATGALGELVVSGGAAARSEVAALAVLPAALVVLAAGRRVVAR